MKNLIKIVLKSPVLYIIIIAGILFFFLSGRITSCRKAKEDVRITVSDKQSAKQAVIDSIVTEAIKDTVRTLKIEIIKNENTISVQAIKIKELSKIQRDAETEYKNDTIHTEPCDKLMEASRKKIDQDSIQIQNYQINEKLHKEEVKAKDRLIGVQLNTIAERTNALDASNKRAERTWWERNDKYVYSGVTAVVVIAAIKLASELVIQKQ